MNLFKSLLFLHGHFVRLEDIEPARVEEGVPPATPTQQRFLGGRPIEPLPAPQREPAPCG